jgi:hypothetical protein
VTVPDVSDLERSEAADRLKKAKLTVHDTDTAEVNQEVASGLVIRTEPAADVSVDEDTVVKLFVSLGPENLESYVVALSDLSRAGHVKQTAIEVGRDLAALLDVGNYEITEDDTARLAGIAQSVSSAVGDLEAATPPSSIAAQREQLVIADDLVTPWWQALGQALYMRGSIDIAALSHDGYAVELADSSREMADALVAERNTTYQEQHRVERAFALVGFVNAVRSIDTVFDHFCVTEAAFHQACVDAPQGPRGLQTALVVDLVNEVEALHAEAVSLDSDFESILTRTDSGELTSSDYTVAYNELVNEGIWDTFAVRAYALQRWMAEVDLDGGPVEVMKARTVLMTDAAIRMARSLRGASGSAVLRRAATAEFIETAEQLLGDLQGS